MTKIETNPSTLVSADTLEQAFAPPGVLILDEVPDVLPVIDLECAKDIGTMATLATLPLPPIMHSPIEALGGDIVMPEQGSQVELEVSVAEAFLIAELKAANQTDEGTKNKKTLLSALIEKSPVDLLQLVFEDKYDVLWEADSSLFPQIIAKAGEIVRDSVDGKYLNLGGENKEFMVKLFAKFGLRREEGLNMLKAWCTLHKPKLTSADNAKRKQAAVTSNLQSMHALRLNDKEAVPKLHRQFGIRHYRRYHTESLQDQLKGKVRRPPQVNLTAEWDWNGASDNSGNDAEEVLGEGLVFIEADNKAEVARRLLHVSRLYGPVKTLLVQAHASKGSISLGSSENQRLKIEDIENSLAIPRLISKRILSPYAQIILRACSTGKRGGIGYRLAKSSGVDVLAPDFDSYGMKRSRYLKQIKFGAKNWRGATKYKSPKIY